MRISMKKNYILGLLCLFFFNIVPPLSIAAAIKVGAERPSLYLKKLKGKRVGVVVNQTSVLGKNQMHLVDYLVSKKVNVAVIFAPEHGIRGTADAGEKVDNTVDSRTKIPIISIYGKKQKPDSADFALFDVLVFDIQDVGTRFYTYISTLQRVMEAAAEHHKPLIVLDRPNPNGHYIDGAILDMTYKSFVGMQPVPIVYGMTIGEYAKMLNGEKWLDNAAKCDLIVITCSGYTHKKPYTLPVKPSPNLPNQRAILLYPSLCFFEGTNVSIGRGTDKQFQIYGSPFIAAADVPFSFVPQPNEGAKKPFMEGRTCYGYDLTDMSEKDLFQCRQIDLSFLIKAYQKHPEKDSFFLKSNFFEKIAGTKMLREQLKAGKTEAEIRETWVADIKKFKLIRKKYLLYPDFE